MNVNSCQQHPAETAPGESAVKAVRAVAAVGFTALALLSTAAVSAQTSAPKPTTDVAPAPAATAKPAEGETAPIEKFDLAAALMAPSGGLTAADAGKRARARAPQIFAAKATAAASQTDVDGSWSSFVPIIDLAFQYKRVNNVTNAGAFGSGMQADPMVTALALERVEDEDARALISGILDGLNSFNSAGRTFQQPVDQLSLSASLQYVVSDVFLRAWPAYKAAVSLADSQKTQVEVAASMVDLTARNAFYDYARALAQRAVDEQALKQAEAQAAQIKLFVDAGTSAQVDHMTAVARTEEARSALAVSQGRVAITQNTLATLMGVKLDEVGGIAEPVLEPPPEPAADADDLLHKAFERRAELRALRKLVASYGHLKDAQFGTTLPTLSVFASDLFAQPNPRYFPPNKDEFKNSWEVGASVAWRLNNAITGTYATRKVSAQAAKARADLGAQEDSIRMEVFSAYQTYKSALTVTVASQARLQAAEEAYRVRLATYRVGAGVIVDLLNADLAVSQARLALANSAISTRAALAALNRAAGLDQQ